MDHWGHHHFFQELGVIYQGMETIAQPINLVDLAAAKPLRISRAKIEICDLMYHYGCNKGGLDRLNLMIKLGEIVGLVGRSGVGKSTFLKLLLRFYDVESGKIAIGGQNMSHVTQDSLRGQTGMVQQDRSLLHRSVHDNIRYSRQNASDDAILDAAKQAAAHAFIVGLIDPDGKVGTMQKWANAGSNCQVVSASASGVRG
jgi:ATP-binding cassette subfamily B multidrug efflux pump